MAFQRVANLEELWSGEKLGLMVEGKRLLLLNISNKIYAFEDKCAHKGVALSQGCLADGILTCSAHHWEYDAQTGHGVNPRSAQLMTFPVKVENGQVLVDVQGVPE